MSSAAIKTRRALLILFVPDSSRFVSATQAETLPNTSPHIKDGTVRFDSFSISQTALKKTSSEYMGSVFTHPTSTQESYPFPPAYRRHASGQISDETFGLRANDSGWKAEQGKFLEDMNKVKQTIKKQDRFYVERDNWKDMVLAPECHPNFSIQTINCLLNSHLTSDYILRAVCGEVFTIFPSLASIVTEDPNVVKEKVLKILKPLGLQNVKAHYIIWVAYDIVAMWLQSKLTRTGPCPSKEEKQQKQTSSFAVLLTGTDTRIALRQGNSNTCWCNGTWRLPRINGSPWNVDSFSLKHRNSA
jgi:hypothetical protein